MTPKEYKAIYTMAQKKHEVTRQVMRDTVVTSLTEAAREVFDKLPHDKAEEIVEDAMIALLHAELVATREKNWHELFGITMKRGWSADEATRFDELCKILGADGSPMYAIDDGN